MLFPAQYGLGLDPGVRFQYETILQTLVVHSQREAAKQTQRLAFWTATLAIATFALALVATVALVSR
jgi:hypothetical protein